MLRRLFLHFFDIHFLEEKGYQSARPRVKQAIEAEARLATRFALLSADLVFVPAASFVESELCAAILEELRELYAFGSIRLIGGGGTLADFAEEKLLQYRRGSTQYTRYVQIQRSDKLYPPFNSRTSSASSDIAAGWSDYLRADRLAELTTHSADRLPNDIEKRWESVPEKLGRRAFVLDYIEPMLAPKGLPPTVRNRVHAVINEQYFQSFTRELCAGVLSELGYLAASYQVPSYGPDIPYRHLLLAATKFQLREVIIRATPEILIKLRDDPTWRECLIAADNMRRTYSASVTTEIEVNRLRAQLSEATVGILTALPEEFAAVAMVFGCGRPIDMRGTGAGRKYCISDVISSSGEPRRVAVGMLPDMGNNSAAARATLMISHCPKVEHIIMCGIAGAVPNPGKPADHVRLGDIVICDHGGVIQYDFDKETQAQIQERFRPRPPGAALLEANRFLKVDELSGRRPWEQFLDDALRSLPADWKRPSDEEDRLRDWTAGSPEELVHPKDPERRPGRPRVFTGPIGSANKLLKNPVRRDALRDKWGVKAIEMEGAGIADAAWISDKAGYFVIRGTCDYCDPDKGDGWHKYAALAAAAYTRAVVEMLAT